LVVWVDADLLHLVHCGVARPRKPLPLHAIRSRSVGELIRSDRGRR